MPGGRSFRRSPPRAWRSARAHGELARASGPGESFGPVSRGRRGRCMMVAAMTVRRAALLASLLVPTAAAQARGPSPGYHPWATDHVGPLEIDVADALAHPERYRTRALVRQPDFHALPDEAGVGAEAGDEHEGPRQGVGAEPEPGTPGRTPDGWVQR